MPAGSKRGRGGGAAAAAARPMTPPPELMAVDTRASSAPGVLFVPEDTTKVAHGDANINIEDFLAKALE